MKSIFSPATALMNRLGYTNKFVLLALISLIAFATVAYSLYGSIDNEIRSAQRELEGTALVEPISHAIQAIQLRRGLSALLFGGDETVRDKRVAGEKEAIKAFDVMEGKLPPGQRETEGWRSIKASWERLQKEGLGMTATENFAAHTRLIAQLLAFEVTIADEYALTLDQQIDAYYLIDTTINKLPGAIEHIGQLRAYGAAILSRKQIGEEQKVEIYKIIGMLDDALPALEVNLEKTGRHNPAMQGLLSVTSGEIKHSARLVVGAMEADILTGHFAISSENFFALTTSAIDKSYGQMYESLLPAIEALFKKRITRAKNMLYASIGVALLLLLIVIYFAIGIYYSIIGNIQSVTRSARAFANGDMHSRICLDTHDELGQIGDSFNEMADGFGALLAARKQAEERSVLLLEFIDSGIVGLDAAGHTTFVNPAAARMLGYTPQELVGKPMHAVAHHSYPDGSPYPREKCPMHQTLVDGKSRNVMDVVLWRKDGSNFPVEYGAHPIFTDSRLVGVVVTFQDVTERKLKDEVILRQANYDALTGLPNRVLFQDRLMQEIKKSNRTESPFAVLFIDLDRFKEINDTMGHDKGDRLLVEAARRINEHVRETDTVARLGGDEFTVILPQFGERLHLERITQNINRALIKAFDLGAGDTGYISASIGIAIYPDDANDMAGLLKHADQAMYIAKANGRNRFAYFTQSMQQEAQEKLTLSNDLRQALEYKELQVYYQPIVELASGRITKAEALLRWNHPEYGMVSPATFIPLAEESGEILEIGKWVFQEAIANIERWQQQFGLIVQISVNVSPVQFNDESTHSVWLNKLMELGLPKKSLTIEITEGLLIKNSPRVKKRLLEFRNSGIEVSLDDFGTGFSSLSYLKQFDIDYLKIDISFIRNLAEDENDRALTEAIIVMAHKLGLKTIAEGVETEGQRDMLLKYGCDYVQGYLYSRPIPANEFEALL